MTERKRKAVTKQIIDFLKAFGSGCISNIRIDAKYNSIGTILADYKSNKGVFKLSVMISMLGDILITIWCPKVVPKKYRLLMTAFAGNSYYWDYNPVLGAMCVTDKIRANEGLNQDVFENVLSCLLSEAEYQLWAVDDCLREGIPDKLKESMEELFRLGYEQLTGRLIDTDTEGLGDSMKKVRYRN